MRVAGRLSMRLAKTERADTTWRAGASELVPRPAPRRSRRTRAGATSAPQEVLQDRQQDRCVTKGPPPADGAVDGSDYAFGALANSGASRPFVRARTFSA